MLTSAFLLLVLIWSLSCIFVPIDEMPCLFHVLYADSLMFHWPCYIPCYPLGVFLLTTSCCCLQLTAVMIRLVVPKFRSQRIWHKWSLLPQESLLQHMHYLISGQNSLQALTLQDFAVVDKSLFQLSLIPVVFIFTGRESDNSWLWVCFKEYLTACIRWLYLIKFCPVSKTCKTAVGVHINCVKLSVLFINFSNVFALKIKHNPPLFFFLLETPW